MYDRYYNIIVDADACIVSDLHLVVQAPFSQLVKVSASMNNISLEFVLLFPFLPLPAK